MTVWIVMEGDYDGDRYDGERIVAVYDSEALANDHIERTGCGDVNAVDVRSVLADVVAAIDPVVARRDRDELAAAARAQYALSEASENEQNARTNAMTIQECIRPGLCHCSIWSHDSYLITLRGYCRHCGGWTPSVFRAYLGDAALSEAIDLLAYHDRVRMRQLTGLETVIR